MSMTGVACLCCMCTDKSKKLLAPIKAKYGKGLSWGDLIILAGEHHMLRVAAAQLASAALSLDLWINVR